MRTVPGLVCLLLLGSAGVANGQSIELYASAGPTITDAGNSVAAGLGLSPTSRLTFAFAVERTHLSTQTTRHDDLVSSFRGGTLLLGTAELQFIPLGRHRFGPFGVAGIAAGVSRPNVNETFPNRISHRAAALFFGGGLTMPLGERVNFFTDARMILGAEGTEGIVAVAPVRAGIAWRF